MDHREAFWKIIRACEASPNYSRRTQAIHNTAMVALGMTKPQRDRRHNIVKARTDEMKVNTFLIGVGAAKRKWKAALNEQLESDKLLGI